MPDRQAWIAPTALVAPHAVLGRGVRVDDFVIIGYWERPEEDAPPTEIGDGTVIRSHATIYAGVRVGIGFHLGHHTLVREFTTIGNSVSIGSGSVIEHRVEIENGVRIHSNAFIPEFSTLEENCWIGPNVVMTNAWYPRGLRVKEELRGPVIRPRAMVGANATLLPAIEVGAGALVGAGSVVTGNVPPLTIVAGNPAKVIGRVDELTYKDGVPVYEVLLGFDPAKGDTP